MARWRLSQHAKEGLGRSLLYVERSFGKDTARDVRDRYRAAFRRIAQNPEIGHRRDDLPSEIRLWTVGPGVVAYQFRDGWVEILAVERAERNWDRDFTDFF